MDKSFIGGLVTGEGSFLLAVHKQRADKIRIKPAFYMQMDDGATMQAVGQYLKDEGHGIYMHHRPERGCWTIQVNGYQRVKRFTEDISPYLTGTKKKAAEIVMEFIDSRLSKPQHLPYEESEKDLVRKLRSVNGNRNGRKNPL